MGGCSGAVVRRDSVSALRRFFCALRPTVDGRTLLAVGRAWLSRFRTLQKFRGKIAGIDFFSNGNFTDMTGPAIGRTYQESRGMPQPEAMPK